MGKISLLMFRSVFLAVIFALFLTFCGCQGSKVSEDTDADTGPVFFPPPPAKPRIQFLKAISGLEDIKEKTRNSFEDYILGKKEKERGIERPYGVAMHDGRIYTSNTMLKQVQVIDLKNKTISILTKDKRLTNPMSLFIEPDGLIYVADPTKGKIYVFNQDHRMIRILGDGKSFTPIDLVVKGDKCYITDAMYSQVLVIDKVTGKELLRMGKSGGSDEEGSFKLVGGIAVDSQGNVYASDKAKIKLLKFNSKGVFQRSFGKLGRSIHDFVRPKGLAIDKEDRIWVVDAGTEVIKIYNSKGQLLMLFGYPGNSPGNLNLPVSIKLDYDNVKWFKDEAVEGAEIEHLVLVTNQYGTRMINVYGFGEFPE